MNYLVTGGTGFLGRNLIDELIKRKGTIYVLVRPGSKEKFRQLRERWGKDAERVVALSGDIEKKAHGRFARRDRQAQGQDRPYLPPRRDLRHHQ